MSSKRALITGISGQDGSYLAELLLSKGYEVHGTVRRSSLEVPEKLKNISAILSKVSLHACSLENHLSVYKLLQQIQPDECYHLAASSFVSYDFNDETSIMMTNFNSTHFLLSCIKELAPECRLYYAGSSEMFGDAHEAPQNEDTRFNPRSIYGISKMASYHIVKNYREHHKIYACTGIAYNHESPRRGLEYVTRKITSGVARIFLGQTAGLKLGNLEAQRDWGYAPDYVEAMWAMLNKAERPADYVMATGQLHSIRELLEIAFSVVKLDYRKFVESDSKLFRPSENKPLLGNASRIKKDLGWASKKAFKPMIEEMVAHDIEICKQA